MCTTGGRSRDFRIGGTVNVGASACDLMCRLWPVQQRGDKVIVFSDNIFALTKYAQALKKPLIYGGTSHAERTRVLHAFKHSPSV